MTIDEAIAMVNNRAIICEHSYDRFIQLEKKQWEQIAELLEELRKMKETNECNAEVLEQQGYNKALDDLDAILVDELEKSKNPYERWTLNHILEVIHELWKE